MIVAIAAAYVATLPFLHPVIATFGFKKVVLADGVFAVLVLAAGAKRSRWLRPAWRSLCVAAAAPPLAIAVCGAFAGSEAGPDIARVAYSMAVMILFAHLRLSTRQIEGMAWTWLITACVVSLVGLLALAAVTLFGVPENLLASASSANLGPGVIRAGSTLGANALALFLQPSLAMCVHLMRERTDAVPWVRRALALLLATAVSTFSRSIVGMFLVLTLALPRHRRWVLGPATAALLTATVAATVWAVFPIQDGRVNTRPNAYRVLHIAAARMFAARPLTGVGPGEFGRRLADFTTAAERTAAWPPVVIGRDYDPHSTWLGWAAECGLLGLAAWGVLYGFIAHRLLDGPPGSLPRLAAAALAGLALSGLAVEISHLKFIWCFLGLGLAARAAEKEGVLV
jgi:O-antigen ligase